MDTAGANPIVITEGAAMNRHDLRLLLDAESVRPDAYDLSGAGGDELYVVRQDREGWSVFYSERGLKTGKQTFDSESEACEHLLSLLMRDPSAKAR